VRISAWLRIVETDTIVHFAGAGSSKPIGSLVSVSSVSRLGRESLAINPSESRRTEEGLKDRHQNVPDRSSANRL